MPDTEMIAVDTSALMAILLDEPDAERCIAALTAPSGVRISAGTLAECLIVAARRNVGDEMAALLDGFGFEIVSVTPAAARRISEAYSRWGKGVHKAGLNFGDCFAYEVAKEHDCPLLYSGDDFTRTDLASALQSD
jgi:ribonuclease VapC